MSAEEWFEFFLFYIQGTFETPGAVLREERVRRFDTAYALAPRSNRKDRGIMAFGVAALGLPADFCSPRVLLRHREIALNFFANAPLEVRNRAHLGVWLDEHWINLMERLDSEKCTCVEQGHKPNRTLPGNLRLKRTPLAAAQLALAQYHGKAPASLRREMKEALVNGGSPERMIETHKRRLERLLLRCAPAIEGASRSR